MNPSVKSITGMLLFLLATAAAFAGIDSSEEECTLHIVLSNIPDSTYLYMVKDAFPSEKITTIDSVMMVNGVGVWHSRMEEPTEFQILNHDLTNRVYHPMTNFQYKFIILENADIWIHGDYKEMRTAAVSGSVSDSIYGIYNRMNHHFIDTMNVLWKLQQEVHDAAAGDSIEQTIIVLKRRCNRDMMEFFSRHTDCAYLLPSICDAFVNKHISKEDALLIYNGFPDQIKKTFLAKTIRHFSTLPDAPDVGKRAIDFTQPTPDGKNVSLSDFRGKYVLLDFWGSGCYPCRVSNPKLVKLYNKYHPLGFEIVGISQDTERKEWIDAIKQDSLPWVNVSDLKGWFNEPSLIYEINAIPTEVLINREGVIIEKSVGWDDDLQKIIDGLYHNE